MRTNTMLRELGLLTHDQRMQRMVALGARARADASSAAVLAALAQGGFYERMLAIQACYSSRDGAQVLAALADPSKLIRSRAFGLIALACDDAQVLAALASLALEQQRRLLGQLVARRRVALVDAFLNTVVSDNLAQLLPYGSPALVAARVGEVAMLMGADDWRRLARQHPLLAADALRAQAQAADGYDQRLVWLANLVLPLLGRHVPDAALDLVRLLAAHVALGQLELQALANRRPQAFADLLLDSSDTPRVDLQRVVRALDADQVRGLLGRGLLADPAGWLERIAPPLRQVAYAAAGLRWRDAAGVLSVEVIAALPADLRIAEARRNLALPTLATRPLQRLPYAACLPWDEARAALDRFISNPDPELRSVALSALIGVARYDRTQLAELLGVIHARRNEQDPVRLAMLAALADLPPSRWQVQHLDALGQVIRAALDARDCSAATAAQANQFIMVLLPFHPQWSAAWLATLGRERGTIAFRYKHGRSLSVSEAGQIAPALLPMLQAWEPREREQAIFSTVGFFGKQLESFPELIALLERLVQDVRAPIASQALALLARYQPDRLAALVPPLLRKDPSWITQAPVYQYLHRRRQDLLTPFLGQTAFRGKFATGKTRFVLPLLTGFFRWTPAQQALFAQVLEQLTRDEARDTPALFSAITQLAALPALAPTRLTALAADNTRLALRDYTLNALGQLDGGQGVPVLLGALDDDRARIAIYALRGALLELPPARALELLRGVPMTRVTVAKEVIRLIGDLPGTSSYADLLALDGLPLQRDLRVALLRALWAHLEQPATWPILERAAVDADPAVARGAIRIPADRRSPAALRRLAALLAALLRHPDPLVRVETLNRCAGLPLADDERVLAEPLLAALRSPFPDECQAAAQAVFATYIGHQAALIGEAIRAILPNRRALLTAIGALKATAWANRTRLQPTAQAVLAALTDDPLTATWQVELAIALLPWPDVAALLQQLAARGHLHDEATMAAVNALYVSARHSAIDDMATLEAALSAAPDPRLRRVALAALVAQARAVGWEEAQRTRLAAFQQDGAALVAAAAQFSFPPS